jgi:2-polyprenyl-6-hydroxyphenyl methylase/3-demethylubiquinone-9 3-methyltransferase
VPGTGEPSAERFAFGSNWRDFLRTVDEERIRAAESSLRTMLGVEHLRGRSFLDVGCGSGLFSLAAARLGAERVRSFDYDADSIAATEALRAAYRPETSWTIECGDVTSSDYCQGLGTFDVVYAWGVLHHTGAMWEAMENATACVADNGLFFVAIYNDQGGKSRRWRAIKRFYNRLPEWMHTPYAAAWMLLLELRMIAVVTVRGELGSYLAGRKRRERGMSRWHDMLDWVGGYPFEVATPEQVFRFSRDRGFNLVELTTAGGGIACNQFVFRREGRQRAQGNVRPDAAT